MTMRIFYILVLLSCNSLFGQVPIKFQFIEYDSIINYLNKPNIKDLNDKWDYESVLLLDSSSISIVQKFNPKIVSDFRMVSNNEVLAKIPINKNLKIKNLFSDKSFLNKIKSKTLIKVDSYDKNFDTTIYIKDNLKAVYMLYGNEWSETNTITLNKGFAIIRFVSYTID